MTRHSQHSHAAIAVILAIVVAVCAILPAMLTTTTPIAQAASCRAFDPEAPECAQTIPVNNLKNKDIPAEYRDFILDTRNYGFDPEDITAKGVTMDGFITIHAGGQNGLNYIPTRQGASVTLPNVGTYLGRPITAKVIVEDVNGGLIVDTNDHFFGFGGTHNDDEIPLYNSLGYKDVVRHDRSGIEATVKFLYGDTGESVGPDFKGVTMFCDLDGPNAENAPDHGNGDPNYGEGVEVLSGFDAIYMPDDDMHLKAFGTNGYFGMTDENNGVDLNAHAQRHAFVTTFTGDTIRLRYSQGEWNSWYAGWFNRPLDASQVFYTVKAKAVDQHGNTIKPPWTVAADLPNGGTWNSTNPGKIDGYKYVGLADGSYPETGTITHDGNAERLVVYQYRTPQLRYDKNGGQGSMDPTDADSKGNVTVDDNTFTRDGYTFTGFNTKRDGTGTTYQPADKTTISDDTTVYAQWDVNKVTITYDPNSKQATGKTDGKTVDWNTKVNLAANGYQLAGHTFTGWNSKPDGTGTAYQPDDPLTLKTDTTLYAQWAINQVTITYDPNNEHATGTTNGSTVNWGSDVTVNHNGYTLDSHVFNGWNTKPDGTGTTVQPGKQLTVKEDTILYAQWQHVSHSMPLTGRIPWLYILLAAGVLSMIVACVVMLKKH